MTNTGNDALNHLPSKPTMKHLKDTSNLLLLRNKPEL